MVYNKERTCPYCNSDKTESKGQRGDNIRLTCIACGKSHTRNIETGEIVKKQKERQTMGSQKKILIEEHRNEPQLPEKIQEEVTAIEAEAKAEAAEEKKEKNLNRAESTLNVREATKQRVIALKKYNRETVDDILNRIMDSLESRRKRRSEEDED